MEKMCTTDESKFCYVRFRQRFRATAESGLNERARELCSMDLMANCARKLLIKDPNADQEQTDTDIKYMCLRRISRDDADSSTALCAEVMSGHVGGYDSTRNFVGDMYDAPSTCSGLQAANDTCTWGCQRAFTPERDSFGCCYKSVKEYFTILGYSDVDTIFGASDLVGSECNRPSRAVCDVIDLPSRLHATLPVDVHIDFLRKNKNVVEVALMLDLKRAVGIDEDGVTIRGYRYASPTSSTVDFTIQSQDGESAAKLLAEFNVLKATGAITNLNLEQLYFQPRFK
jgi:hypothetical protein